jgi:guanylate kinase
MNLAYALIGPPASGKSAIARELRKYGIPEMISYTTREPRPGEKHSVDYYFVDRELFAHTELIEKASYSGHLYGLAKDEVLKKVEENPVTVVCTQMHGFEQLKKLLGKRIVSIFLLVDENTIIERVVLEGGDYAKVQERINYAKETGEFDNWQTADHVVKNTGSLDATVRQILAIMDLVEAKRQPV